MHDKTNTMSFGLAKSETNLTSLRKPICDIVFCLFDFGVLTI